MTVKEREVDTEKALELRLIITMKEARRIIQGRVSMQDDATIQLRSSGGSKGGILREKKPWFMERFYAKVQIATPERRMWGTEVSSSREGHKGGKSSKGRTKKGGGTIPGPYLICKVK